MNDRIFIQIASYRDPQLIPTIKDCIQKSKYPENLIFSIAWQHSKDDIWDDLSEFKNDKRFKIIDINYLKSEGACWARNMLQQNYDDEEYTLQLDSHHRFIQDWDNELIKMYKQLKNNGVNKPLITGYIPSYDPDNDPKGRVNVPWKMNFDRFTPEGVVFFLPASIKNYEELTEPIPSRFYSGHFAFTTGKFVKEVPHDPNYYFHGEEISIAVRAYTWGYDLYHPHKIIAWHEYTRKGRTKHWDDINTWSTRNTKCHERNRKLFSMDNVKRDINFGIYDFGKVRTLEDYEKYSGVSFKKRSVQQYTLDNNLPPNPILEGVEYEKSFVRIFKHCIDVDINQVPEKDYEYWAVAFHDENNNTLYRKDAQKNEINDMLRNKSCKIWRQFETSHQPKYWVVWPYSTSKGWCLRLTGKL